MRRSEALSSSAIESGASLTHNAESVQERSSPFRCVTFASEWNARSAWRELLEESREAMSNSVDRILGTPNAARRRAVARARRIAASPARTRRRAIPSRAQRSRVEPLSERRFLVHFSGSAELKARGPVRESQLLRPPILSLRACGLVAALLELLQ